VTLKSGRQASQLVRKRQRTASAKAKKADAAQEGGAKRGDGKKSDPKVGKKAKGGGNRAAPAAKARGRKNK